MLAQIQVPMVSNDSCITSGLAKKSNIPSVPIESIPSICDASIYMSVPTRNGCRRNIVAQRVYHEWTVSIDRIYDRTVAGWVRTLYAGPASTT